MDAPRSSHLRPTIVTAQPFIGAHGALAQALRESGCPLRLVSSWPRLLRDLERQPPDVVLLDLDAPCPGDDASAERMSAPRLAELIALSVRGAPTTLVAITALDYAEIEDVVRAGIRALLPPTLPPAEALARILAAWERRCRACGVAAVAADAADAAAVADASPGASSVEAGQLELALAPEPAYMPAGPA